ncbi:hypothetical protein D3C83_239510 [compost metagenome]
MAGKIDDDGHEAIFFIAEPDGADFVVHRPFRHERNGRFTRTEKRIDPAIAHDDPAIERTPFYPAVAIPDPDRS